MADVNTETDTLEPTDKPGAATLSTFNAGGPSVPPVGAQAQEDETDKSDAGASNG